VAATRAKGSRGRQVYETPMGRMLTGPAEHVLAGSLFRPWRGRVQLLFTSPPFPLNREKKYGNLHGQAFADWLAGFAPLFTSCLTPDGSIVLELGNGWEPGRPTMSTTSLKALLAFQEAAGLHLCQEFICHNPARLPSPAQWVTVNRIRVKDSFTRLWWLAPTPYPKADNRRVLTDYSPSMLKLLRRGTFNPGRRPSQHHLSPKAFLTDNGGAIPPNVLVPPNSDVVVDSVLPISNTASRAPYRRACKEHGVAQHPAVMPEPLVEFFVQFLTDPNDVVLDPFAGSNTTGSVAERLGRRWVGVEANPDYAESSRVRFMPVAA
jgi:site-specific DNA-methyltransferase (cytosine-N4-specific)